jgi:uncharacterized OB-fold protein
MAGADETQPSPAAAWAQHCRTRRLGYQIAPDGTPVFPPRLAQPRTGAPLTWRVSEGRGEVYASTVLRRRGEPPESLALVDLDEGFRMMSSVVGIPPQDVTPGMRVRIAWRGRGDEPPVPVFEVDQG